MAITLRCRTCDTEIIGRVQVGGRWYGQCARCADRTPIGGPASDASRGAVPPASVSPESISVSKPPGRNDALRVESRMVPAPAGYRDEPPIEHVIVRPARRRSGTARGILPFHGKRLFG